MKWIVILLSFLALYGLAHFCEKETDDFSLAYIHSDLPYCPEWETPPAGPEAKLALEQKFHYLGSGGQSFAFVSENGEYVIKFFKQRYFRKPYRFLISWPRPGTLELGRLRKYSKALSKLRRDFSSYKLASEELKEESGLLLVHLNKGKVLNTFLTIVDKIGIGHTVDLDNVEFILQRRADSLFTHLEQGDLKESLRAVLEVIASRCQKGIFDEDPRLHNNLGFIGSKAMFIDVGRFVRDPQRTQPEIYKNDLKLIVGKRLVPWLQENHPELVSYLDQEIDKL